MRPNLSTHIWDRPFWAWACSTRWIIVLTVLSSKLFVVSTTIAPLTFRVPAKTAWPGPRSTGTASPVTAPSVVPTLPA